MLLLLCLLMLNLQLDTVSAAAICDAHCSDPENSNITCAEFNSWSEVNKELISNNCTKNPPIAILLKPSKSILLTSELNISVTSMVDLRLYDVGGVNVYPWPVLIAGFRNVQMFFVQSIIEFYVN
jgi:hypothetical protein